MQEFPHHYQVTTRLGDSAADVVIAALGLPDLATAPPIEFGGPGNCWSPETLLMAAVCDCFVLGFKVIAAASRLTWSKLDVRVTGTLDRVEKKMRFTHIAIDAELTLPAEHAARAPRILEKAESSCLIMNSLTAVVQLNSKIIVD